LAKKKAPFPKLTADQAHAALRWLHALGKVTSKEIAGALRERDRLADEIRRRLEELGGQAARFLTSVAALRRPAKRRRTKVSAKARAAWKAQGRYMAAVRRLPKAARVKIAAIRKAKGVAGAIAAANRAARSSQHS
jgi:hypothetical protein